MCSMCAKMDWLVKLCYVFMISVTLLLFPSRYRYRRANNSRYKWELLPMLKTAFRQEKLRQICTIHVVVFERCVFSSIIRAFKMRNNDIADLLLNFSRFPVYSLINITVLYFLFSVLMYYCLSK